MTYQEVLDLINTKLASNAKITASKHRTVETALLNYIQDSLPKNRGYFDAGNIVTTTVNYPVGGDIVSATKIDTSMNGDVIQCTMANAMPNTNYKVIISPQSLISLEYDNDIKPPIFRIDSATQFSIYLEETHPVVQNLRIHLDVIQL